MEVTTEGIQKATETLQKELSLLIPRSVTFPSQTVRDVLGAGSHSIRFEVGIVEDKVTGFLSPVDENGKAGGSPRNDGAPCPPFCGPTSSE